MFTRLLVGLDGSSGAEAALTTAIDLARRFRSTIVLAVVTDIRRLEAPLFGTSAPPWTEGVPVAPAAAELGAAMDLRARRLLDAGAALVEAAGLRAETVRAAGLVDDELVRLAGQAEALVVGRRGELHGRPGSLGTVTVNVVKRAPKTVLVAGEHPSSCERPVVAFDGGDTSTHALALAARYADAVGIPLDVVHVTADRSAGEELLARAGAFLSSRNVAYETHCLDGEVVRAVADFVARERSDLLVAGAHGGRRRSWSVGSHAEKLLRATSIPVIIDR